MKLTIHRGSSEIGGTCIELEHDGRHLVLDLGMPLSARTLAEVPLPPIPGLAVTDPRLAGVVLSHSHEDHAGQVRALPHHVPLYLGEGTHRILAEAAFWTPGGLRHPAAGFLRHRVPMWIGPFKVTPYLVDHSAFDAYALLVEAGGLRVFYSGDLRAHGRKAGLFEDLVADPPRGVDIFLLEGTHVSPTGDHPLPGLAEHEIETACLETFRNAPGLVLACFSAQNIDRLVSIYRAARRADRELVVDLYTASIAAAAGCASIPQPGHDGVRVYLRNTERSRIIRHGAFDRVGAVRAQRIFPEELAARASQLVVVGRDSVVPELSRLGVLDNATVVWSMWRGYLNALPLGFIARMIQDNPERAAFHHASGHAFVDDLRRLVAAVAPATLVPVHTLAPQAFSSFAGSVPVTVATPPTAWQLTVRPPPILVPSL